MKTNSSAKPTDVSTQTPLDAATIVAATYADLFGMTFNFMRELSVDAMTLAHRATEFWLTWFAGCRAELACVLPSEPISAPSPEASSTEVQFSSELSAGYPDKPEDDGVCCGDACTSKTCSRALKALEFDVSDHSLHGH
jgi:hypothetical protein